MERIYVTVRARPLSPEEQNPSPWGISGNTIYLSGQPSRFEFDRVFTEDCKTMDVYKARTKDIVSSAVKGFNGTVFAYGQTSSGKTHTMRGSISEPGIIPLAVHDLFHSIQETEDREFLVRMSYMEIYNEEINDLLSPEHRKLQIHESLERGIFVAGLKEEIVASPSQVLDLMEFGESHRHIGETNMNLYSSRSHTIFRMIVESREKAQDDNVIVCDAVRVSILNLVDLAGSERAAKTGAEGVRLKEGSHINKSLMALGSVIKKLSDGAENNGGHVPYRDSKLTRILQPALGGNANTAMICNVTLSQVHADETKSSLQFASRALRVKNYACVNEILTDAALLKRQRKQIEELQAKLLSSHSEHMEEEIRNLRNTLLQSELEKERITLELMEEKKSKAQREKILLEQAKRIENLSSLVLYSERDENISLVSKNLSADQEAVTLGLVNNDRNMGLPPPFEELVQGTEASMDNIYIENKLPDNHAKNDEEVDFLLPDAHALLHVTSRRKVQPNRTDLQLGCGKMVAIQSSNDDQFLEDDVQDNVHNFDPVETETTHVKIIRSSPAYVSSIRHKNFIDGEYESMLIKQLEDQSKMVEMENAAIQRHLHSVIELTSQQNAFFRENYEEFQKEVVITQEEVKMTIEQLHSLELGTQIAKGIMVASSDLSREVVEIVSEVDYTIKSVEKLSSFVNDVFHNSILSKVVQELESFTFHDIGQLWSSVVYGHTEIQNYMRRRIDELEGEKEFLHKQLYAHQKQIDELKTDRDVWDKARADGDLQHEMEKDELLCQILSLREEVSSLSSCSLTMEMESMRKELDKAKAKLKDSEFKLTNTIQEKIKLEDEYQKSEACAFELMAEIHYLKEALASAVAEKEAARATGDLLGLELELVRSNLSATCAELAVQKEDVATFRKTLAESDSVSKKLQASIDSLTRQKEEMAMQLTDALLEAEAEKSTWLGRMKTSSSEISRLTTELLEVRNAQKSYQEESILLKERLAQSVETAEREKEFSLTKISELTQIITELNEKATDRVVYSDETLDHNNEGTNIRIRLLSMQAKLDAFRGKYGKLANEYKLMNKKYEEASTNLKKQLVSYGHEILDLKKRLANYE